jgi:hypothetical protein
MLESLLEHLPLPPVAVLEDFRRLGEFRPFPPSNTPILTWTLMFTPSYSSLTARPILPLSLSLLTLSVSSQDVISHAVDLSLGNLTFTSAFRISHHFQGGVNGSQNRTLSPQMQML